jgi:hypothetical protein
MRGPVIIAGCYRNCCRSGISLQRYSLAAGSGRIGLDKRTLDDSNCLVPPHGVPVDDVIPMKWRSSVIDEKGRINRISYELCVLSYSASCAKEIWIVGADRYRNPIDELPRDFDDELVQSPANQNSGFSSLSAIQCSGASSS